MKPVWLLPVFLMTFAGCNPEPVVVSTPPVVIERPLLKTKVRPGQFRCAARPKSAVSTNRQAAIYITKLDWIGKDCARKNDALLKMITDEK